MADAVFDLGFDVDLVQGVYGAIDEAQALTDTMQQVLKVYAEQPIYEAEQTDKALRKQIGAQVRSALQPASNFIDKAEQKVNFDLTETLDSVGSEISNLATEAGLQPGTGVSLTSTSITAPVPGNNPSTRQYALYQTGPNGYGVYGLGDSPPDGATLVGTYDTVAEATAVATTNPIPTDAPGTITPAIPTEGQQPTTSIAPPTVAPVAPGEAPFTAQSEIIYTQPPCVDARKIIAGRWVAGWPSGDPQDASQDRNCSQLFNPSTGQYLLVGWTDNPPEGWQLLWHIGILRGYLPWTDLVYPLGPAAWACAVGTPAPTAPTDTPASPQQTPDVGPQPEIPVPDVFRPHSDYPPPLEEPNTNIPPIPVDACFRWNRLEVGSDEWCQSLEEIMAGLSELGLWFCRAFLRIDPETMTVIDCPTRPSGIIGQTENEIQNIIGQLGEAIGFTKEQVAKLPQFLKDQVAATTINPTTLLTPAALTGFGKEIVTELLKSLGEGLCLPPEWTDYLTRDVSIGTIVKTVKEGLLKGYLALIKCNSCNVVLVLGLTALNAVAHLLEKLGGDVIVGVNLGVMSWTKIKYELPLMIPALKRVIEYLLNYVCPPKIPMEGEIKELVLRGEITEEHGHCLLRMHGLSPYFHSKAIHARREKIPAHEIIEYCRRRGIPEAQQNAWLKAQGWIDEEDQLIPKELYNEIPTITDHLEWNRKSAWNLDFVKRFRLLQGFDTEQGTEEVTKELEAEQGDTHDHNFWAAYGKDLTILGMKKKYAANHYISHWSVPSAGEAARMLQRLRPEKYEDNEIVFTEKDYNQVLQDAAVAPGFRKRWREIAYEPIGLRFIQAMYFNSVIEEKDVVGLYEDLGYKKETAEQQASSLTILKNRTRRINARGYTVPKIVAFYQSGLMQPDEVVRRMDFLGMTKDEARELMEVADRDIRLQSLRRRTATIKKCYLTGKLEKDIAVVLISEAGMAKEQAVRLVESWELEKVCGWKESTTAETLKLLKQGLIDASTATQQLIRQQRDSRTIGLLIASATIEISQAQQKHQAALAKSIEQTVKRQLAAKKKTAKIKLDIDKAHRKADLILAKDKAKEDLTRVKHSIKGKDARSLAEKKQGLILQLARLKADLQRALSATQDSVEKGRLKGDEIEAEAVLKSNAADDAVDVQDSSNPALLDQLDAIAQSLAQLEADTIIQNAEAEAELDALELAPL